MAGELAVQERDEDGGAFCAQEVLIEESEIPVELDEKGGVAQPGDAALLMPSANAT